jgi:raffinose/stachyose/melibiose transport system permease protein
MTESRLISNPNTEYQKKSHSKTKRVISNVVIYFILILCTVVFIYPIILVLINSFKKKLYITDSPFTFPNAESFNGIENYAEGLSGSGFWTAALNSVIVTVFSVILILLLTSMAAWYLTRVNTWWSRLIYYAFVFSMLVPFQMVMLPLVGVASKLHLDNVFGVIFIYIGYGAGLSTFLYSGFVKTIPTEIEEAAAIDGCSSIQLFFRIVTPIMKPTTMTVAVLNIMWIWNDYLLPSLVLGTNVTDTTLPVAIQVLNAGRYGDVDIGVLMAMIVLAIIPIILFYLVGQKYIVRGVTAGAVKG